MSSSHNRPVPIGGCISKILGVHLPQSQASNLWDMSISGGAISSVVPHDPESLSERGLPGVLDASERLLVPSLCHSHIHLDKCFLLQDPKFSDLEIVDGDFQEAMALTAKAKVRFEEDDLLRRGRQLITESISYGVTAMRAFVELDGDIMFRCLDAGLKLKDEFRDRCDVQICAFAQLPLFSGEDDGHLVRNLMAEAMCRPGVDVLGSTPYVEEDEVKMRQNVHWITEKALQSGKMLDLHLDYFMDERREPLVWSVLEIVKEMNWRARNGPAIALGHCTRLTLFTEEDWIRLRKEIGNLPVSFVGLPRSDLFMMRTTPSTRGTLNVLEMIRRHGLNATLAVNNVGNAFTPQGDCDPLGVASLGVAIYQAATQKDTELLFDCVSSRAKAMIGIPQTTRGFHPGEPADFVLFGKPEYGWRNRKSIAEIVYDAGRGRQTIKHGRMVS